ncbi:5' exonuclease Apollo-like [Pleurodeles waltl]
MNGAVIPKTPIAVDCWKLRCSSHVRLFFLSHMHSDHTVGLTSTWMHPIYCSAVSGLILHHKLQVNQNLIRPLEIGVGHKINLDELGLETMTVTLIDANHCPGSVMFLFEGYFGTILYTGDFRYSPDMVEQPPLNNKKKIDVLYLDNTNCNPNLKLPSRQQATEQIKDIISSHPEHNVVIGLYSIGKESLLVELARFFRTWIVVSPQRLELLKLLELEDVFTSDEAAGRIIAVEHSAVNYANMMRWNRIHPTIAILPTSRQVNKWHKDIHVVPYSDHSSFEELLDFVEILKPSSLEPVVKNKMCQMYFRDYLSSPKKTLLNVKVPESVKEFMRHSKQRVRCEGRNAARWPLPSTPHHIHKGVIFESPEKNTLHQKALCSLRENQKSETNSHVDGTLATMEEGSKTLSPRERKRKDAEVPGNANKWQLNGTPEEPVCPRPCESITFAVMEDKNGHRLSSQSRLVQWLIAGRTARTSSCKALSEKGLLSSSNSEVVDFTKQQASTIDHLVNAQEARTHSIQVRECSVDSLSRGSAVRVHLGEKEQFPLVPPSKVIIYNSEQFHRAVDNYCEKFKIKPIEII